MSEINSFTQEETTEDFRRFMSIATPQFLIFGDYFSRSGDDRIKDKLAIEVGRLVNKYSISPETVLMDMETALQINYSKDSLLQQMIYEEALKELGLDGEVS